MPVITRKSGVDTVWVDANGKLMANRGYENSVADTNNKWITFAEMMGLLGGGTNPWIRWSAGQCIVAPVVNPADCPAAYWSRIYVPTAFRLDRYQYGLIAPGLATDGALWLSVWSEVAGAPAVEYTDARAVAVHGDKPAGMNEAYCGVLVDFGVLKTVDLAQGWIWLSCVVDTSSPFGITVPGIDYFDSGAVQAVGRGGRKSLPGSFGGFAALTDLHTTDCRWAPAIYLGGTIL